MNYFIHGMLKLFVLLKCSLMITQKRITRGWGMFMRDSLLIMEIYFYPVPDFLRLKNIFLNFPSSFKRTRTITEGLIIPLRNLLLIPGWMVTNPVFRTEKLPSIPKALSLH